MRIISVLLLIAITCMRANAQTDDIPDYRNKKEGFAKLTDKALRSDLAAFTLGGIIEGVSKESLPQLPVTEFNTKSVRFGNDKISVTITSGLFDKSKHKLLYYDEKYLVRIDNKPYWGIYGQVPQKTVEALNVVINSDTVAIPATATNDLYEPRLCTPNVNSNTAKCSCAVYLSKDNKSIYIYMLNSDGSNGYEITWVIQDKQYVRRVVDYGF